MILRGWRILLPGILVGMVGCSRGLELVDVSGLVTLDGKPISGAAVTFLPKAKGPAAYAVTDPQGRYQLSTINQSGVVPGDYRVVVTLKESNSQFGDPAGVSGEPPPGSEARIRWIVPQRYAFPASSQLETHVDADHHTYDIPLTTTD